MFNCSKIGLFGLLFHISVEVVHDFVVNFFMDSKYALSIKIPVLLTFYHNGMTNYEIWMDLRL